MPIDQGMTQTIAEELDIARKNCSTIAPLASRFGALSIEDAYEVQRVLKDRRMAEGARVIGKKIGLTSRAVQDMLGVKQPDFGYLFSDMAVPSGGRVARDTLIQPKIEGEIAFVLKNDLRGPGLTSADVLGATKGIMACFEIVDSRIADWKIGIVDTVADNASSALFVLGDSLVDPADVDLGLCGMVLERNGEVAVTGAGAAALGSPVNAVVWLANMLGTFGVPLLAGEVILSGALGAMVPVQSGDRFRLAIGGIGRCSVAFD